MIVLKQISSLEKVLPKVECTSNEISKITKLSGERYAYQVAFYAKDIPMYTTPVYDITINSELKDYIKLYKVNNVPVNCATYSDAREDENYISKEPGLYPDILEPMGEQLTARPYYQAVWVEVAEDAPQGNHAVEIVFKHTGSDEEQSVKCTVEVLGVKIPEQKLVYTNWFHADCIASYYGVEVSSPEHWELVEKFMTMAHRVGMNMILTPIFTPALDTEVGGERPTTQLVKIEKTGDTYSFDFTDLKKWIDMAHRCGIRYFEMAHLFTQWGAKFTPKIVVRENGEDKKLFGWHVDATSDMYRDFLAQFLPAIDKFLKAEGVWQDTVFHISDEPNESMLEDYFKAKALAAPYLEDYKIIDALSNYEFYEKGVITSPVPASNYIIPFIEGNVPDLWTYTCCSQYLDVSNRFISMPSYRNRSIGMQMYKYNIVGFLHWGYNFYYKQFSKGQINPFFETDGGEALPSGDAFCVYPGEDGPMSSIRAEVFYHALQDMRVMELLETKLGHDGVVALIENFIPVEFDICARSTEQYQAVRDALIMKVKELF